MDISKIIQHGEFIRLFQSEIYGQIAVMVGTRGDGQELVVMFNTVHGIIQVNVARDEEAETLFSSLNCEYLEFVIATCFSSVDSFLDIAGGR